MIDGDCRVPLQSGGFEGGSELRKAREIYERTQAVRDSRKRLCKVCTKCNRCSFMKNRKRKPHVAPGSVRVMEDSNHA